MASFKNPIGKGLTPERVDMGVDFGGSGPLYALGHGVITTVYPLGGNSGWPGGGWIGLKLDDGREMYYAEDVSPLVHVGQTVKAGQHIANATGGSTGIEVGWASGQGTSTKAAQLGQQNTHGDPGAVATAMGADMANLIHSLGGPMGIITGAIHGTVPKGWQSAPSGTPVQSQPTTSLSTPTLGIQKVGTGSPGIMGDVEGILQGIPGVGWIVGTASGIADVGQAMAEIGNVLTTGLHYLLLIFQPSFWLRIGSFFVGTLLLAFGAWMLFKAVNPDAHLPSIPMPMPIPVP